MNQLIAAILDESTPDRNALLGITAAHYKDHNLARLWRDKTLNQVDKTDQSASKAVSKINGIYDLMIEIDCDLV